MAEKKSTAAAADTSSTTTDVAPHPNQILSPGVNPPQPRLTDPVTGGTPGQLPPALTTEDAQRQWQSLAQAQADAAAAGGGGDVQSETRTNDEALSDTVGSQDAADQVKENVLVGPMAPDIATDASLTQSAGTQAAAAAEAAAAEASSSS